YIDIIPKSLVQTAFYFNWLLLLFNLLPIYPLDGGKLLFYILSLFLPYKKAHQYTYRFSLLSCILLVLFLFFNPFTLTAVLLLLFLMGENYQQWRQHPYIFMRFLLQRMKMLELQVLLVDQSYILLDLFSFFKRTREPELKAQ